MPRSQKGSEIPDPESPRSGILLDLGSCVGIIVAGSQGYWTSNLHLFRDLEDLGPQHFDLLWNLRDLEPQNVHLSLDLVDLGSQNLDFIVVS